MVTTRVRGGSTRDHRVPHRPVRPNPADRRVCRAPLVRVLAVFLLTLLPFSGVLAGIAVSIAAGSPLTYLASLPILIGMVAVGYHSPPDGVGDAESDWILAALFGGLGLFLRHLMSNRFPTLSGLWELPLVGAVLWGACITAVLFGVRRVIQLWVLWLFAVVTVTPLPFLLATAALGGGAIAAGTVSAVLGGIAVVLAARCRALLLRMLAGFLTVVLSFSTTVVVSAAVPALGNTNLLGVLVAGGLIPLAGFITVNRLAPNRCEPAPRLRMPARSPAALVALIAGAGVVFVLNMPYSRAAPTLVRADPNWAGRLNLPVEQSFSFIHRYLGPAAAFTRYRIASAPGQPEAAVDVITTDNLATLLTYRDAVWYPATVPPNYRPFDIGGRIDDGRSAATDSTLATDSQDRDWYIVTWLWQVGRSYQQIFVVVNQTWTAEDPPPVPVGLSLRATVIGPALWLVRQQANPAHGVDGAVSARADRLVSEIVSAGESHRDE